MILTSSIKSIKQKIYQQILRCIFWFETISHTFPCWQIHNNRDKQGQPTQNPLSKSDGLHFLRCNILRCNSVKYSMTIFATRDHVRWHVNTHVNTILFDAAMSKTSIQNSQWKGIFQAKEGNSHEVTVWTQKGSVIISGKTVLLLLITLKCICLLEQHHSTVLLLMHFNRADNFCFLCILLCLGCNTVGHESYLTKCREENKTFIKKSATHSS